MWKKIRPGRRKMFLKALAETGNVALAAEHAKLSRSWVQSKRSLDPEFAAECEAALERARARLGSAEQRSAGKKWRYAQGEELVVKRGDGSGARRTQIARARRRQWTPRTEAAFLAQLAATCNVKAAAAAAGMSVGSAYAHRKRWAGFERRWHEAIELGMLNLEFALLARCTGRLPPAELTLPAPMPPMSADEILHSLHMHKHEAYGIGRKPGGWGRPPPIEAVTAKIVRNAEVIRRVGELRRRDKKRG